ncbi:hypothetical protein SAMN05216403_10313 [Nitrosospira multiformis ATCC 25196]|uniref:Uncharacterized protein n=1 Tax=Nitrosospira multiformis (strain ATCC 25196 / NCIMB 11849 / C 71) TaxID=323848 RepID=A0A1H5STG1_NITMU|nr:hypothetical protein SAMN05216403_10313 [Nitrosospira multiformis ATCC 25196]
MPLLSSFSPLPCAPCLWNRIPYLAWRRYHPHIARRLALSRASARWSRHSGSRAHCCRCRYPEHIFQIHHSLTAVPVREGNPAGNSGKETPERNTGPNSPLARSSTLSTLSSGGVPTSNCFGSGSCYDSVHLPVRFFTASPSGHNGIRDRTGHCENGSEIE